jgi:phospholipid/cholesterol/gamma-HCH transport system substrate-binding protein
MSSLRRLWVHLRASRGLGWNLALVAAVLAAGVLSLGYLLSQQQVIWIWEKRVEYQAEFVEAPAVKPGKQEVRIAGVVAGDIAKAQVTQDGRARLTLSLEPRYGAVYDNARVFLRPKSPLNDMYVLLDPGGPPGKRLRPGSVIAATRTERPIQADEVLSHLDGRTRKALSVLVREVDAATAQPDVVPPALRGAARTLSSLQPVVEELEGRQQRIRRLVTALADIATAVGADDTRLRTVFSDARTALDALSARDAELDATLSRLPGVTAELRRASKPLQALAGELNPALDGLRAAAGDLPGALASVEGVVERLDRTLDRAGPLVVSARPVVADLRPVVSAAGVALDDISHWSPRLDPITANLVRYLPSIQQVIYQVSSLLQVEDANGPTARVQPNHGAKSLVPPGSAGSRAGGHTASEAGR